MAYVRVDSQAYRRQVARYGDKVKLVKLSPRMTGWRLKANGLLIASCEQTTDGYAMYQVLDRR